MILSECFLDLGFCLVVGELAPHERTGAAFLHQFALTVAGQFDEALIAIDDRVVDDLSIRQ